MKYVKKGKWIALVLLLCVFVGFIPQVNAASTNNFLADVSFDIGSLDKPFDSKTINYYLTVPNGTEKVDCRAVASDSTAKVQVGGENLSTGKVVVTVTAEAGNKKYYTFFIKYGNVTTTTPKQTTTTPKPTTTPKESTTPTSSTTDQEPIVSTPEGSSSAEDLTSSALAYLGIKDGKLNREFDSEIYEYNVIVDESEKEFELEYITKSSKAVVEVTKSKDKYVLEVMNEESKTTYVINLQERTSDSIDIQNDVLGAVLKDLIIAFVLLVVAIVFFVLSKRLRME
ncbi:MAG: cadherin-like beta sandwich domain-containing protein [Erysipelotrichales bacterium]|nr:cadherin-like beta sandwich domain-containing protein [Erysipelotrichales bacterium]